MVTKFKNVFIFLFLIYFGCSIAYVSAAASSPKKIVEQCLKKIKDKKYSESYEYFSSILKSQVSLQDHISNLQNIENNLGRLVDYSDKLPIFRNYFLDENMFSGLFSKKKQLNFKYLLNFERGSLVVYAEIVNENNEYKLSVFYLKQIHNQFNSGDTIHNSP